MQLPCLEGHTSAQGRFFPLVVFPVFFGPGLDQRVGRAVCEGPGARKWGCWSRGGRSEHHWHFLSCSSGKLVSAHVAHATWQKGALKLVGLPLEDTAHIRRMPRLLHL